MKLALRLFDMIGVEISERLRNSIKIYKYLKYYALEHKR